MTSSNQIDTPKALYPHELDDDLKAELEKGYQGKETPKIDHLLIERDGQSLCDRVDKP